MQSPKNTIHPHCTVFYRYCCRSCYWCSLVGGQDQGTHDSIPQSYPPPLLLVLFRQVHAIGVCDSPGEFYDVIHTLATELGLKGGCATDCTAMRPALTVEDVRSWLSIYDGQGMGYAISTEDELRFITEISGLSGIGFDPVYSGKALYKLFDILRQQKTLETEQRAFLPHEKVLFIHTGGILGMYDKIPQLLPLISEQSKIRKLEIS